MRACAQVYVAKHVLLSYNDFSPLDFSSNLKKVVNFREKIPLSLTLGFAAETHWGLCIDTPALARAQRTLAMHSHPHHYLPHLPLHGCTQF